MSRWVVPERPSLKATGGDEPDGPLSRIVKYVPAEVVTAYTLLFTALLGMKLVGTQGQWVTAGLIALFFVATIAYVATRTQGAVRQAHLAVSPLAFLAWAYPISSALLGDWFVALAAFGLQAVVIALGVIIAPREP